VPHNALGQAKPSLTPMFGGRTQKNKLENVYAVFHSCKVQGKYKASLQFQRMKKLMSSLGVRNLFGRPERRNHIRDRRANEKVILEWILVKYGVKI
jgi:hypothetical protein